MLYLLSMGWEWLAAAAALGALVGFATTRRGTDGDISAPWLLAPVLLALLGAGVATQVDLLAGREELLLEIGVLATAAYFLGLPLGGGAKGLLPAPVPAPAKPTPVVVRGVPPEAVAPAPAPRAPIKAAAPKVGKKTAPVAAGKKPFPGHPPESLPAPRGGMGDDLSKIKGIGPKSVEKLHALGVFHYDQIAAWNFDNARWIGAALAAPGRVERGKWIQQARELLADRDARETSQ